MITKNKYFSFQINNCYNKSAKQNKTLYSPPSLVTLLPGLPHSRGVHSEVALLLVHHHQQHGAPGRVELLPVLHLLVGRACRVQLGGTEIFLLKWSHNTNNSVTHSTPPLPLIISSMVVSLYRSTGQLYLGVLTCVAGVIIVGYSQLPL